MRKFWCKLLARLRSPAAQRVDLLTALLYHADPGHALFAMLDPRDLNRLRDWHTRAKLPWRPHYLRDTREFFKKFGLDASTTPAKPGIDLAIFRVRCLHEEVDELANALPTHYFSDRWDPAAALDALVDLLYFTFGTAHVLGLDGVLGEAWRRVHKANLTKVRARASADSKRGSTYDVVKPQGWVAPSLTDLVERKVTNE